MLLCNDDDDDDEEVGRGLELLERGWRRWVKMGTGLRGEKRDLFFMQILKPEFNSGNNSDPDRIQKAKILKFMI